jgi:signal recognition particle subunit SRP54
MFTQLRERFDQVIKTLRGYGRLSEDNIAEALREVRLALLEADVNVKVTRQLLERVRERAVGQEVLGSLTPGQQVVQVVFEEIAALMGGRRAPLAVASQPPTIIMLVGLNGSGKTTTAAKLGRFLQAEGRRPLLVAADLARPAAVEQLVVLGRQLGVAVHAEAGARSAAAVCAAALDRTRTESLDPLIVDTAGRQVVDAALMEELRQLKAQLQPHEILMVADAMTGQDAVNSATAFHEALDVTGFVLTKLDGDARGGAALSLRAVTGRPVTFVGVGEKPDALEPVHPDRMASRILGMGDVLTLVEKAQEVVDQREAEALAKKMRKASFTLEDFKAQLQQMKKMGPLDQVLGMIPGLNRLPGMKAGAPEMDEQEREFRRMGAIIDSMTKQERRNPGVLDGGRRRRIAAGSGTTVADVNRLVRQFSEAQKMMKQLMKGRGAGRLAGRSLFPPR